MATAILMAAAGITDLGANPSTVLAASAALPHGGLYEPGGVPQATPLRVEVLDGLRFREIETGRVYRLYGIATCLPAQKARLDRQSWPCGTMATAWLVSATLGKWLSCATIRDEDGERVARCATADHLDLAAAMVHDGIAVTLPATAADPGLRAYAAAEREARKAFRGLWASSFEMPWDYRARLSHDAVIAPLQGADR